MNETCEFFVPGVPVPGGSKRAFVNKTTGAAFVTDANKETKIWQNAVRHAFNMKFDKDFTPLKEGIKLDITFLFPRPKSHFHQRKTGAVIKKYAPLIHTKKPDRTKLLRSTEDALKGLAYLDDAQVCAGQTYKLYTERSPGAIIKITAIPLNPNDDEKEQCPP